MDNDNFSESSSNDAPKNQWDNRNLKCDINNDDTIGLLVHSYNNHLAAMMGFTEIALLECGDHPIREKLELSLLSGKDAIDLGNGILASLGRLQIEMSSILLTSIITCAEKLDGVEIELDAEILKNSLESIEIKTNTQWFVDCLKDLTMIVKSMLEADTVRLNVSVEANLRVVKIQIHAPSVNLSDEAIHNLFQPFYSSRKIQSTKGIGLAKAKGFFGQMQSKLIWQNAIGFELQIPIDYGDK